MHNISIPLSAIERGRLFHPTKPIDPAKTAVIAIDFQRFFIDADHPMGNVHARDILENANHLHSVIRSAGGVIVFTQHSMAPEPTDDSSSNVSQPVVEKRESLDLLPGSPSYDLHASIYRTPQDWVVIKRTSSPLHPKAGTRLDAMLRDRNIETLIISGLVTNGCCDCTARDAFQHGYNVIVASDATAAMTDEEHNAALLNLSIYYAEAMSVAVIAEAVGSGLSDPR